MRLVEEEKKAGVRMFDVIDLHFYPSTSNPAEIAQLHRVFFDKILGESTDGLISILEIRMTEHWP
ncbi:MAG: hypothetical protein IPH28_25050 [Cytophagaceae bacterium]|nr:hypothetical protein [Cytophagaceae bacterium]